MIPGIAPHLLGGTSNLSLLEILNGLGLTANLKLCLDAGDASSYTSGQSWLDRSGNGYDFFRGATSSATTDDPTFNGNAGGLSSSDYWSFDGGDFFRYDTTNEAWMNNIHKASAKFGFATWVNINSSAALAVLAGTRGVVTSNTGFTFAKTAGDITNIGIFNAGATVLSINSAGLVGTGWKFLAVSLDATIGANGLILQTNDVQELFTSTYSSPAAIDASFAMEIAARGNGDSKMANLNRMGGFMAWEGVAPTAAELLQIFNATRSRFGV